MIQLNRRKFLWRSALALATTITPSVVKGQISKTPGSLESGLPLKKIIIMGAGVSGLVAAYELSKVGHIVSVLEASPRVGGRVLTLRNKFSRGHFVEAGAARILPYHDLTLAYSQHFGLNLQPFYPKDGLYIQVKDNQRTLISASDLSKAAPQAKILDWTKIEQGSDRLPLAFAKALSGKIRLGDPVTRIEQTSKGVQVLCQSGIKHNGDFLLCTIPLTVMNHISVNPPLSSPKQVAISGGYNYRPATRMFVEFPERFWEKEGLNGWGRFYDRPEELWHPTWDSSSQTGILHSYLKGELALMMDALQPEARLAQLLLEWEKILPSVREYPVSAISYSWTKNPWSMGGWAYPTKSQEQDLFEQLQQKEGRIHFAGEHTSKTRGWIQGALESGIRAAKEIHFA